MKHSLSTRKDLTILKLEEAVFDIRHSAEFRQAIESLVGNVQSKNLIIDFSPVKAIDSSGISSMLLAHQLANQSEGLAIFVSLCHQIKELLKLTNLDKQLYIFSSINEVMTLIEPSMKGKKGQRGRSQPARFEPVDEIADEIEILPEVIFEDEHFDSVIDDQSEEPDEPVEQPPDVSVPKKRGRPKKNAAESQNTSE